MINTDNILFFNCGKLNNRKNLITFSIVKKAQYIRINIGKNIASQIGLNALEKIKFGCDKNDFTKWYLICNNNGYNPREENNSYLILIPSPFKFQQIKVQKMINKKDFEIIDNTLIKLNVIQFFKNNKLILKD